MRFRRRHPPKPFDEAAFRAANPLVPDITPEAFRVIPPGDVIREHMGGLNEQNTARLLGVDLVDFQAVLAGAQPVGVKLAQRLEDVFGPSTQFWLRLDEQYRRSSMNGRRVL